MAAGQGRGNYVAQLEEVVKQILRPLHGVPFNLVIEAMTGQRVLFFDADDVKHRALLELLAEAAARAGWQMNHDGIVSQRANEVGNKIEPYVRQAINDSGRATAEIPKTASGKKKAAGYPDIEIRYGDLCCYLECKTYNAKNMGTTQRSFYLSPSRQFKVTRDALHLMLAYEMQATNERREGKTVFRALRFKLLAIESLSLDLKHEFNSDNRRLYSERNGCRTLFEQTIEGGGPK